MKRAVFVVMGLTGVAVLFLFDPSEAGFFLRCPLHLFTGLHCPGCGAQRALHLLLHGDVIGALRQNALTVVSLPFLAYAGLHERAAAFTGRARPTFRLRTRWIWMLAGVVVLFFILRNVPIAPFTLLTPR